MPTGHSILHLIPFLPVLISVADLYAAMVRASHISEEFLLEYVGEQCDTWTTSVLTQTGLGHSFPVRRMALGLLQTRICESVLAHVDAQEYTSENQYQAWVRRGVLLGAYGQRSMSASLRMTPREDTVRFIAETAKAVPWVSMAAVGAQTSNRVEDALRRALPGAHVIASKPEEDALEATDIVLTWPRHPGGFLIQVKTATRLDAPLRVQTYNGRRPQRYQFCHQDGPSLRAVEARRIGDRHYTEALRVHAHARHRWERTREPWYAAFITVQPNLSEVNEAMLVLGIRQSFTHSRLTPALPNE